MQITRIKNRIRAFRKVQDTVTSRWMPSIRYTPLENVGTLQKPMQITTKAVDTTSHKFLSRKRVMWTYHLTLRGTSYWRCSIRN